MNILVQEPIAQEEVQAWLDYKRVKPQAREKKQESIDALVEGVMYGQLTIDPETKVITQKLDFPVPQTSGAITELKYAARCNVGALQSQTMSMKGAGQIWTAYASSLTNTLPSVLNAMDSEDFKLLQAIVSFFL